jgi:hypothetical protein
MRNLHCLDHYRDVSDGVVAYYGNIGDESVGIFNVPSPTDHRPMRIVASSGEGWDHVSVSLRNRCPNWSEMEHVKRLFFKDDETAMQLHVPPSDHISVCHSCLHLWRPHDIEIPRPPAWMVA